MQNRAKKGTDLHKALNHYMKVVLPHLRAAAEELSFGESVEDFHDAGYSDAENIPMQIEKILAEVEEFLGK